ncbi:MAG TPA: HAMP domain-containing histidine kinase [Bacilli bacterium]|nr:HAMP domain-containing histidine kinase [Bacilli bacterium]
MKKNIVIISNITFIIIIILFNLCSSFYIHNQYKKEIINNNAKIIANIADNDKLENKIVESLLKSNQNIDKGIKILEKYDLSNYKNIDELKSVKKLEKKLITINMSFSFIIIIFYTIFLIKYNQNTKKEALLMQKYMDNILIDNYNIDFNTYDDNVLSSLKDDIYKMTIKLKNMADNSNKEKKYLATTLSDISHQLKTPLTSLFVFNEILKQDNLDLKTRKEILEKSEKQLERIKWLITSLLKMSQLDSGSITLQKDKVNLQKLINESCEPFLISLDLKNVKLQINIDKKAFIICDKNWTIEAISNIVKNALEHVKENGTITIQSITNPIYLKLEIIDDGEGIKAEEINHIFERFYHGNKNKDSIGIGLNMSKMIIEKQKGHIEVESKLNKGTKFSIYFYHNK